MLLAEFVWGWCAYEFSNLVWGKMLCECIQTFGRIFVLPPSWPCDFVPFKVSGEAHRKTIVFLKSVQKQSRVCQTCQTRRHTKLLSSMSLMRQRAFKIYERSFKTPLQWTVITLEIKIVTSSLRK